MVAGRRLGQAEGGRGRLAGRGRGHRWRHRLDQPRRAIRHRRQQRPGNRCIRGVLGPVLQRKQGRPAGYRAGMPPTCLRLRPVRRRGRQGHPQAGRRGHDRRCRSDRRYCPGVLHRRTVRGRRRSRDRRDRRCSRCHRGDRLRDGGLDRRHHAHRCRLRRGRSHRRRCPDRAARPDRLRRRRLLGDRAALVSGDRWGHGWCCGRPGFRGSCAVHGSRECGRRLHRAGRSARSPQGWTPCPAEW